MSRTERLWMPRQTLAALLVLLALLMLAPPTLACGLPIGAGIDREQALLVQQGTAQQMIVSVNLLRSAPEAAVIFPVPAPPQVQLAPQDTFRALAEATAPEIIIEERFVWRTDTDRGAPAGAAPVSVLGREQLGGYDVARLAANDAAALQEWLTNNQFGIPAEAEAVLASYIADDWAFVAVRLAPGDATGPLAPLAISYTAENLIYPLRLGALASAPFDVELYVASAGRVRADGLETTFAGPAASLTGLPADVAALLGAPYLTKLERRFAPGALPTADAQLAATGDDTPFRRTTTLIREIPVLQRFGVEAAILGVLVLLSLSLIPVGYFIRRRLLRDVGD